MARVILFGTSTAADLTCTSLRQDSPHEIGGFTVDRKYMKDETFCGLPVVPFEEVEQRFPPSSHAMMVAVYASRINTTRAEKYAQAREKGYELISHVSTEAIISPGFEHGDNCFIGEGVIIRPRVKLGNNVIVMPGAFLGHDLAVHDHCFIGSRATVLGAVTIGPYCVVGANATVTDAVTIGRETVVGAGCVIHADTNERSVYRAGGTELLPLTSDRLKNVMFRR